MTTEYLIECDKCGYKAFREDRGSNLVRIGAPGKPEVMEVCSIYCDGRKTVTDVTGIIVIEKEEFYFEQVYPADYAWWHDVDEDVIAILEELEYDCFTKLKMGCTDWCEHYDECRELSKKFGEVVIVVEL